MAYCPHRQEPQPVRNPANHHDIVVNHVRPATEDEVDHTLATASGAADLVRHTGTERADILIRAAQLMEDQLQPLLGSGAGSR